MIKKTIKVGSGIGPTIDMRRYSNAHVEITGLRTGKVHVKSSHEQLEFEANGTYPLKPTDYLDVVAHTSSCVIVKLMAEQV